ncbi:hypothetical protein [Rhizobium sp. SYY.PMSO]|uniref:hypothetical protein n=1 Tax=Rhizobium sp. SYY.PMSO TaxID=3382192 RepID=UPI00398FAC72
MKLEDLSPMITHLEMVGSRVTCSPAPTDTVLILAPRGNLAALFATCECADFEVDGSRVTNAESSLEASDTFKSFKKGDLNFIVTADAAFFKKFMAATSVARRLNLLDKADRVALFQAVLYGNSCDIQTAPSLVEDTFFDDLI